MRTSASWACRAAYRRMQALRPMPPQPRSSKKVENPDVISPKQRKTTMVLVASAEARVTSQPVMAQLYCQAIVNGKLGPSRMVREVPLMVVESSPKQ